MARIVDLNELVPEDVVIRYGHPARDYVLPGDISVEAVFRLFEMFQAVTTATGEGDEIIGQLKQRFGDVEAELLSLFRERDPTLEKLPFGITAMGHVLRVILAELGLTVTETDPTPPPRPEPKRARSVKTR